MANALFANAKKLFLDGDIDLLNDTIKVVLIDTDDDDPDVTTDDYYNDILAAARVATSGALTSKTTTAGQFDAADVTLSSVTGDVSEELLIWKDTTAEESSPLIACFDTATGLPVTPNGGDITIAWQATSPYIFAL